MKKILASILCACFALITSFSFAGKGNSDNMFEIIHKPNDQAIIITVNINSLPAHIAHGDCVFDVPDGGSEERKREIDWDEVTDCADIIDGGGDDDES